MTIDALETAKVLIMEIDSIDDKLRSLEQIKEGVSRENEKGRADFSFHGFKFSMGTDNEDEKKLYLKSLSEYEKYLKKKKLSLENEFKKL